MGHGGVILSFENLSTWRKHYSTANVSTINPTWTWTGLGMHVGLHSKMWATYHQGLWHSVSVLGHLNLYDGIS